MRGSRIQNIVNELSGERIDVIKWDPDPANFVSNALSPAQVVEVEVDPDAKRASVVVPDRMLSLAIGKEGQNARLAAKLTGWSIDIRSQSASERGEEGIAEAPSTFEPFAPGEEPDIDIIAEAEEVAAAAEVAEVPVLAPVVARPAAREETSASEEEEEEDIAFASALAEMPIIDRDERESEDYGEEEAEDEEEYEVPTAVVPEQRPSAIRFAEDVRPEPEDAKKAAAAAKKKRAPRFVEELDEDMEEIDYSGRIH
jgi:N utilization substance protein A